MSDECERGAANEKPKLPGGLPPAAPCPDCRGSGQAVLLVSTRPCARCGGSGRLDAGAGTTPGTDGPNPTPAAPPGRPDAPARRRPGRTIEESDGDVVRAYTYDAYGRVASMMLTRRDGAEAAGWQYECFAGPEDVNGSGDGGPAASEPSPPDVCSECNGTGIVTFQSGRMLCTKCRRPLTRIIHRRDAEIAEKSEYQMACARYRRCASTTGTSSGSPLSPRARRLCGEPE